MGEALQSKGGREAANVLASAGAVSRRAAGNALLAVGCREVALEPQESNEAVNLM